MAGAVEHTPGLCIRCGRVTAPRDGRSARFCAVCGLALPQSDAAERRPARVRGAPPAATAALLLGLCSLMPMLGLPLGILAVILGRRADTQIVQSRGELAGRGMAAAGTVLGVFGIMISVGLVLAAC